jgi:O-antigen/teichoic acid export membrane protein
LGYKLLGVVISAIISVTIMDVIAITIILKRLKFTRPRFSNMKLYVKWGILLTPNDAVMWIINASDKFIVNYFLGASATGIYNASYGIGFYAAFAVYPLGMVLYPYLTKAYSESRDDCAAYLKYSFKYLMMITIPAAFGLAVLAKSLLLIFTTSEFVSGSSVTIFSALAAIFFCFYQLFQYVLYLTDKTQIVIKLLGVAAVLNVVLNLIFVPIMGITGAGLSSFIAYGVLGGLTLIISRKSIRFDLNIIFLMKSFLASSLMAVCIWLINPGSIIMLLVSIIIGLLIYFGALILLRGLSKDELQFFASFIRTNIESIFVKKSRN